METADAVVIGAGINGASTAYHLVKRGLNKVVLIEKHLLAAGGTGRSAAIVRQHYSNEELVRLARRSVDIFTNFADAVGGDCGFVACGWAFLVPETASKGFSANMAMLQQLGVKTWEISKTELLGFESRLKLDDVCRIAYEPGSGYADPHQTTYAYVQRFRQMGGRLQDLTSLEAVVLEKSKVVGVQTSRGPIATRVVVNAAGPWADRIAHLAGVSIPIKVTREEEIVLEARDAGGPPRLVFSDMAQAIYYRPDGATRTLVGRGFPKEYETVDPNRFKESADEAFIEETLSRLRRRLPAFQAALAVTAYAGLYDVTPDWHPILGKTDGVEGFYQCNGFSGHGFKLGPAIGEAMAEEILEGRCRMIDLEKFSLSRFDRGNLFRATYGGNRA
ncbi:MAG: FAD-binding oxidoreductase [Acidobacteriota bacterium]